MRLRWVLTAALLAAGGLRLAAVLVPQAPPAPAPADLARLIQAHYDGVTSFTADFTHAYRGGLLPQVSVEQGTVKIKKPGRMWWSYKKPEVKEIVADGRMLYTYIKADRVCYVSDVPKGDTASTAVLFLAGKGNLSRDFRAAAVPNAPASEWRLRLTPLTAQPDFTELVLGVDPKTLALITLESSDADGGKSTFTFTKLRENVALADRDFAFTPPKGVDVIR